MNLRSRVVGRRALSVTGWVVLGWLLLTLAPSGALADRVVVLGASGSADEDQLEAITDAVSAAARALAHDAVSEAGALDAHVHAVPEGANELRAVAELNGALWVVVPIVHDVSARGYWITLRVGYARDTRVEELDAEVLRSHEGARLQALLRALLRPEGVGDDVAHLAGADPSASEAAERDAADAERLARDAREAEEQAARERAEAEAREAEEQAAREQSAFEERERYGNGERMLVQAGIGVHPLLRAGRSGSGGTLGSFQAMFGYALGDSGLELRAGLDIVFGAAGGFGLHAGAAYLASPFRFPLHVGAGLDLGFFYGTTGNRVASLLARVGPLVVYHATEALYLEAQPLELTILSANGGAVALGISVRAGTRF